MTTTLFVQGPPDTDVARTAAAAGASRVVATGRGRLDGLDVVWPDGQSGAVTDPRVWTTATAIATEISPGRGATATCARQIAIAEVVAPYLVGVREAAALTEVCAPRVGDVALVSDGPAGDGFAARLGLPRSLRTTNGGADRRRPLRGARPRQVDVLFVELFSYRLTNLTGIAEELRQRGKTAELLCLASDAGEQEKHRRWAADNGVGFHLWSRWIPAALPAALSRASGIPLRVLRGAGKVRRELAAFDSALGEAPLRPLLVALGGKAAKAAATIALFRRALSSLDPAAVFTCRGDGPTLRALGFAGEAKGVPVIDVQHGRQNLLPPTGVAEVPHVRFAFASDHPGRVYRAQGIAASQVALVGSVGFDRVMAGRDADSPYPFPYAVFSSCAASGTNVDAWNAATRADAGAESTDQQHAATIRALDDHLGQNPELRVVVVLHPREAPGITQSLIDQGANTGRFVVLERADNGPLFAHARFHVSLGSTTSLEATLVGTPAVVIEPELDESYFEDAVGIGAIERVSDLSQLPGALARAAERSWAHDRLIDAYAVSDDRRTVDRILELDVVAGRLV